MLMATNKWYYLLFYYCLYICISRPVPYHYWQLYYRQVIMYIIDKLYSPRMKYISVLMELLEFTARIARLSIATQTW